MEGVNIEKRNREGNLEEDQSQSGTVGRMLKRRWIQKVEQDLRKLK